MDGHPDDSQALPLDQAFILPTTDAKWVAEHVHQTRYTLQIVKFQNEICCEPFVIGWFFFLIILFHFQPFIIMNRMGQLQWNHQSTSKDFCQAQQKASFKENPNCRKRITQKCHSTRTALQCKESCPMTYVPFVKFIGPVQPQCCVIRNVIEKPSR